MNFRVLLPLALCALSLGCAQSDPALNSRAKLTTITVTITSSNGKHNFQSEVAKTAEQQEKGLMFRTDIADNYGMLFWPYPPEGGPPREAVFWMKNTPSPLDIIYIRANGTITRIAQNTLPNDETQIPSGEPVGAVLEVKGGRTAELGIAEGDTVAWPGK